MMNRVLTLTCIALAAAVACSREARHYRTFATPEEAVHALTDAAKQNSTPQLLAIFGPDAKDLVESSDSVTARRNREVFTVAVKEGWRLVDQGSNYQVLVIGNEGWPFPIPLVREGNLYRFDTDAGKEEVISRRIGRNELAAISICRAYITAQRLYASQGHDGKPSGLYARTFASDPGKQNGLYWASGPGQKRSPLGELVAQAGADGQALGEARAQRAPFHGYYYKILTAQGAGAFGGAKDYVAQREMSGGFALVAWPAEYDATGVMTFVVSDQGIIRQKDLGGGTETAAKTMLLYNPDDSWGIVQ